MITITTQTTTRHGSGIYWLKHYIAPIERSAKLRESLERRDHGHEKTMDRQGKARASA